MANRAANLKGAKAINLHAFLLYEKPLTDEEKMAILKKANELKAENMSLISGSKKELKILDQVFEISNKPGYLPNKSN